MKNRFFRFFGPRFAQNSDLVFGLLADRHPPTHEKVENREKIENFSEAQFGPKSRFSHVLGRFGKIDFSRFFDFLAQNPDLDPGLLLAPGRASENTSGSKSEVAHAKNFTFHATTRFRPNSGQLVEFVGSRWLKIGLRCQKVDFWVKIGQKPPFSAKSQNDSISDILKPGNFRMRQK